MTPTLPHDSTLRHRGWILAGLSLAILMSSLDTSIVNVALPALVAGLHASFAQVQWVVLSYLLVVTALIVGVGRLGDLFGKRRLYLFGILLFTVASAACGLATTCPVLVGARAIQGLGAAIMMALSFALAADHFPKEQMGKTMGLLSGMVSLGFAMGPSLAGLLVGSVGWPAIFLVNVPFGILAVFILWKWLPETPRPKTAARFDWTGTLVLGAGMIAYALSMTESESRGFADPLVLSLIGGCAALLVVFWKIEGARQAPLIHTAMLREPLLATSIVMGMLIYSVMMSVVLLFPFFMGVVDHYSPQKVGLLLSVGPLVTALTSALAGSLADKIGHRKTMVGGLLFLTFGCWLVSTVSAATSWPGIIVRIATLNFSLAFFQTPNNTAVIMEAPAADRGVVSGLLSLSRTLGLVTGASVMGAVFAYFVGHSAHQPHLPVAEAPASAIGAGLEDAFLFGTGMIAIAFLLGVWTLRIPTHGSRGPVTDPLPLVLD